MVRERQKGKKPKKRDICIEMNAVNGVILIFNQVRISDGLSFSMKVVNHDVTPSRRIFNCLASVRVLSELLLLKVGKGIGERRGGGGGEEERMFLQLTRNDNL